MRRTDLMDTSLATHRLVVKRLRNMSTAQKFKVALDLTDLGGELAKSSRERRANEASTEHIRDGKK